MFIQHLTLQWAGCERGRRVEGYSKLIHINKTEEVICVCEFLNKFESFLPSLGNGEGLPRRYYNFE